MTTLSPDAVAPAAWLKAAGRPWRRLAMLAGLLTVADVAPAIGFAAGLALAISNFGDGLAAAAPWLALAGALATAGLALFRDRLPRALPAAGDGALKPLFAGLNRLHSGVVNDYVVWMALGLAMFAGWATF